jgi:hypothetical protein
MILVTRTRKLNAGYRFGNWNVSKTFTQTFSGIRSLDHAGQSVLSCTNALGTCPPVDIFTAALNPASHSEMTTPHHQSSVQTLPPSSELEVGFQPNQSQYPSSIELHKLGSWFEALSLKGIGNHIRSLYLNQRNENWITPDILMQIHDFFPNVESLALVRPNLTCPYERARFECFSEKLTSLSLECAEVDQQSLLAFVCLFQNWTTSSSTGSS